MKLNKIFALIGSIIYSCIPVSLLVMGVGLSHAAINENISEFMAGFNAAETKQVLTTAEITRLFWVLMTALILITLVFTILNWVAFVKLSGKTDKKWRGYLLVVGILTILFGLVYYYFPVLAGILFILAFALNRKEKSKI
ncbi:MAG: hypothetical protein LBI13_09635 [Streptococcaceae bacterium]|jgi:predicted membrane protein|nr:hypothetical protein [Streptococcaceae bacterium]